MVEGAGAQLRRAGAGFWRGRLLGLSSTSGAARALGAGFLVLALFLLALEVRVFAALPAYAATVMVFVVVVIVPGLILHQALAGEGDPIERLAFAIPFGLAIAAPAGLVALSLPLDLQTFGRVHMAIAAPVCAAAALRFRSSAATETAPSPGWSWGMAPLLLLLAIVVGGIFTSPVWAGDGLSRDLDEWRYATMVNSYMDGEPLDPLEPVGIGERPYGRFANNVWLVVQASVAKGAGISAEQVVLWYLTPLLTVLALAATYALAKGLFGSRTVGLLAALLLFGYACIDLSPHEGIGRNVLLRMSEDKMLGTYILFPVGLILIAKFVTERRLAALLAFVAVTFALFVVHPQPLMYLTIALASFVVVRAIAARSPRPVWDAWPLAIPPVALNIAQVLIYYAVQEGGTQQVVPGVVELFEAFEGSFRLEYRVVQLPGDLYMGNYHLIMHPLMVAALLLVPLVWLRSYRTAGNQLLFATMVGWLPLFFVPPLATVFFKLTSMSLLVRLPWMAPVAVVLAYVLYQATSALAGRREALTSRARQLAASGVAVLAPAFAVTVILGAALLVQESYVHAADGGFYRLWPDPILPGTEQSIFRGGEQRLHQGQWRVPDHLRPVLAYLRSEVPEGSVVLAPTAVNIYLPGTVRNVKPVHSPAVIVLPIRSDVVGGVYGGGLKGPDLAAALERDNVDYVLVARNTAAFASVTELSTGQRVAAYGPWELYSWR